MPGQETGVHKHLYDYIVTPITNGKLLLIDKNGNESKYNLIASQSYLEKWCENIMLLTTNKIWFLLKQN